MILESSCHGESPDQAPALTTAWTVRRRYMRGCGYRNGDVVLEVDSRHYVIHIQHDAGQIHHIMRVSAMKSICLVNISAKDLH
jgi:hypothetical protein